MVLNEIKMKKIYITLIIILTCSVLFVKAQNPLLSDQSLKFRLNEEGTHYVRLTFLNQVWVRYTETNPGSTVFNSPVDNVFDIGLRRTRFQLYGQVTDKVFFYTQFGQNNFSYLSQKFTGAFFHDALVEYHALDRKLALGAGLSGWNGVSRYASPSVGSFLSLDAPLYQQTTNSVSDQFLRKLSVYAKGKLGKLDYRLALAKPMAIQNASPGIGGISFNSNFSKEPPKLQTQGYFMYQFLDEESNTTPYTTGTYLGKKRVFNIGAGFQHQKDAMWHLDNTFNTVFTPMTLLAVDVFYDAPLNEEKGNAITAYGSFHHLDYGPGYIRNVGVMNPANGTNGAGTFNGAGDAFPMLGTGNVFYGHFGYLIKKDMLPNGGTLQPYIASQYANFNRLTDNMMMIETGVNWFIHGTHASKFTFNYQNRPVFEQQPSGDVTVTSRKGMYQLQFQISI